MLTSTMTAATIDARKLSLEIVRFLVLRLCKPHKVIDFFPYLSQVARNSYKEIIY